MTHPTFAVCVLLLGASSAWAGGHGGYVRPTHAYRAHAAVPPVQFFYFVGQPVRIEALVAAEIRRTRDDAYFPQLPQARREANVYPPSAPVTVLGNGAALARRCTACHRGPAPEGGLSLEGATLSAEQITAAQRRVLRGEMPPAERLAPEEAAAVVQDLLRLEQARP